MPCYAASISEMLTMPVGVLTTDYIDVWCNTATDTPHKIRAGDLIAVKWNADVHDHEYTWCTVLATTHVASGVELTLMHEQAVDVPGHPAGDPTHVTYSWKVYTSDYRTKWMVYNFDNAAEHTEHVLSFVNEVHFDDTFTFDDCWDANGVIDHLKIANLSGVPGDFDDNEYDNQNFIIDDAEHANHYYTVDELVAMNDWWY